MGARFILIWQDDHDFERNARRVADGVEQAVRGTREFVVGATFEQDFDTEEGATNEPAPLPAFQALLDEVTGQDLYRNASGTAYPA